jgi:hypothetical protein
MISLTRITCIMPRCARTAGTHRSRSRSTARDRKKYSYRPLLHQHGWTIRIHPATGEVTATRPDGRPYEIRRSQPHTSTWRHPVDDDVEHDAGHDIDHDVGRDSAA